MAGIEKGFFRLTNISYRPGRDWPLCARYWIPNLRIISPEGLQVELKKGLAEYLGGQEGLKL